MEQELSKCGKEGWEMDRRMGDTCFLHPLELASSIETHSKCHKPKQAGGCRHGRIQVFKQCHFFSSLSLCTAPHRAGFILAQPVPVVDSGNAGLVPHQPRQPAGREPHVPRTSSHCITWWHPSTPLARNGQASTTGSSTMEAGEPRDLGTQEEGGGEG